MNAADFISFMRFSGLTNTSSSTFKTNLALEQRSFSHFNMKIDFSVRLEYVSRKFSITMSSVILDSLITFSWKKYFFYIIRHQKSDLRWDLHEPLNSDPGQQGRRVSLQDILGSSLPMFSWIERARSGIIMWLSELTLLLIVLRVFSLYFFGNLRKLELRGGGGQL